MRDFIYALKFRLYLWWNVPKMPFRQAMGYPVDLSEDWRSGDPYEDAREEMSCMIP